MGGGMPRIGFAGMTHLGVNSAAAAAEKGFDVVAFDSDTAVISRLRDGRAPVVEPGLDACLDRNRVRLSFTADATALAICDVVYVAPDVPTDDAGAPDLGDVRRLLGTVTAHARADATIVVLSQVPPGFSRAYAPVDRTYYYQVETLIFGRALERALSPERFIVGCGMPDRPLQAPYDAFLRAFGCPILPMRYESAELAKIAINCCLVATISAANTLAEVCEGIGADWSEIVPALRLDKRIGQHAYLKPGLGIAGGNLERDLRAVVEMARGAASDSGVVRAWIANSRHRRDWALKKLYDELPANDKDATIAVLGLAYKENTHSTKNSASLELIRYLTPYQRKVHDPVVGADAIAGTGASHVASPMEAVRDAAALVVMTPWPEYGRLAPAEIADVMAGRLVLDPFAVLNGAECRRHGLAYHTLGTAAAHA